MAHARRRSRAMRDADPERGGRAGRERDRGQRSGAKEIVRRPGRRGAQALTALAQEQDARVPVCVAGVRTGVAQLESELPVAGGALAAEVGEREIARDAGRSLTGRGRGRGAGRRRRRPGSARRCGRRGRVVLLETLELVAGACRRRRDSPRRSDPGQSQSGASSLDFRPCCRQILPDVDSPRHLPIRPPKVTRSVARPARRRSCAGSPIIGAPARGRWRRSCSTCRYRTS